MTFLVHGEPVAMEALQASIKAKLGWNTKLPEHDETVELLVGSGSRLRSSTSRVRWSKLC